MGWSKLNGRLVVGIFPHSDRPHESETSTQEAVLGCNNKRVRRMGVRS